MVIPKLLLNKYVILALIVFICTWSVQEWRHDAKLKRAYEKGLAQAKKQDKTDLKLAEKFNKKIAEIEKKGRDLETKATDSNTVDSHFIRLYNESL